MNGHTHATTSLLLAGPVGLSIGQLALDPGAGILAAIGCAAGVLLSPDLDQEAITESQALVYRSGGRLLGSFWRTYWLPYALLLPHRHWASHAPLISTLGRLAYLLLPFIAAAIVQDSVPDLLATLLGLWPAGVGLAVSDVAHWVMDTV